MFRYSPAPPSVTLDSESRSMPEETAEQNGDAPEGAKKKGAGLITVLLAAVIAGGGAGAGTAWFVAPMSVDGMASRAAEEGEESENLLQNVDWELYTVDNLVLNPAGTRGRRFLVASVAIEVDRRRTLPLLENSEVQIRDGMIRALSSQGVDELADPARRPEMEDMLRRVVSDITDGAPVGRVYFSRFVLQ